MAREACNETDTRLTLVRFGEPSLSFAQTCERIGYNASVAAYPKRPDEQLRNFFDPDNPEKASRLLDVMRSGVGRFAGVVATWGGVEVGYAWAHDDVGAGGKIKQLVKYMVWMTIGRLVHKMPFVCVTQLNVLPEAQGQGVGMALLREVLGPFDLDQRTTAYVFNENGTAREWFQNRGYAPSPSESVDPNGQPGGPDRYFGEGAEHVRQWRLQAPCVAVVKCGIDLSDSLPAYGTEERVKH